MSDSNHDGHVQAPSDPVFEKLVMTVDDVAAMLQVSKRHVFKLVSMNRIPYSKIGRRTVFVRSRITEWLLQGGTR